MTEDGECCLAVCHLFLKMCYCYAECRYARGWCAECRGTLIFILFFVTDEEAK